jgi:hypothetical protein
MRHLLVAGPPVTVACLARRMADLAAPGLLIAAAGGAECRPPGAQRTGSRAVALPPITAQAEEEHLSAVRARADDEP